MFIRDLSKCRQFIAGDNTTLKELFNPREDDLKLRYSLAHAVVKPGDITHKHRLRSSSEVYYIIKGKGRMHIDDDSEEVYEGHAIYIPPNSVQWIKNIGIGDLVFICIVEPPWQAADEEVIRE